MSPQGPQKVITGICPNCGPSRIIVVLEGWLNFTAVSTSTRSCDYWAGRCCQCHACFETHLDSDLLATTLEWTFVDEEKLGFLFGDSSPPQDDLPTHPPWNAERDG
jgi:hypothetical protein